ncbi:MAG: bifunctional pyr operon transcriptional regulator/uracil phosphoribosyltransferase PyrR [Candidatus Sumerlaeia bacterium]|nr:bifunctional pyr operon transcriptional regulator/uracil phosphoribosyltransferase PyrR [Candidatus Sumerlaeia bacterium]
MAGTTKKTKTPAKRATVKTITPKKTPAKKPSTSKGPVKVNPTAKVVGIRQQLLDERGVSAAIEQLVQHVYREFPEPMGLVILGVRTRGVFIAERMKERLDEKYGVAIGIGTLDITFYRDDLSRLGPDPMVRDTTMPFDIDGANVILVDDVLYTGRTIRAAIDEICDFGRPAMIRLAVLVDRGLREYPLHADYCALRVQTTHDETVQVNLEETDDRDEVVLAPKEE